MQKIRFNFNTFPEVLKNRNNLLLYTILGLCFGIYYVIHTAVGKKFLEDFCRMESAKAAAILSGMGIMSGAASFLCVYINRMLKGRCKPFFQMAAVMTTLGTLLISIFTFFEIRSVIIVWLFWILSFVSNIAPINLTVLRDLNKQEYLGTAVSCGNAFAYIMVAVLGSASGFFMDLFPPNVINGVPVYGRMSYFSLFLFLFILSLPAFFCAFRLPETGLKKQEK